MSFINKIKGSLVRVRNFLLPTETIGRSKSKWDELAKKNARYYVLSSHGENISEEDFFLSGEEDYQKLVASDSMLKGRLGNWKDKRVLEIGCGLGRITKSLSENFGEVVGLDISSEMIEGAKKRLAGKQNLRLLVGDGVTYSLPDDYFDLVFSFIVFQHMPSVEVIRKNIEEIARVLKAGGLAKIQLRGVPVAKGKWFYGPSFDLVGVKELIKDLPLDILAREGEGQRYFWVILEKKA